jgi:hypothetical protein
MIRATLGGLFGGVALFLTGFIFWRTPLAGIALSSPEPQASANLQAAMAQALTQSGTGVYVIPSPATSEGTVLYGKGPVAQVMFNTSGFPVTDNSSLIAGFILSLVVGVLIALALRTMANDFAARARMTILFSLAAVLWMHIGQPIFNHAPWRYFLYLGFSDFVGLVVAGLVAARWFMTKGDVAPPS